MADEPQARAQSQPTLTGTAPDAIRGALRSDPKAEKPRDDFAARVSQDAFVPKLPEVTLPKSGGAIRGLGEKFSVASATGTANLSVPLPLGAARMTPQLALAYNSGAGNGTFGLGWTSRAPRRYGAKPTGDCRNTTMSANPTSTSFPAQRIWCRFSTPRARGG